MGPMAEDFAETFGLGDDDESIATIDADGVALAAIQGLAIEHDEMLAEYQERIDELERENDRLRDEYKERIAERREEHEREIKRLKREQEERIDQLEREYEQQVARLEDEYEERITELEEEYEEEIADLQEENERLQTSRDDLQRQLAATSRRVDQHQDLVDYVEEQRSLERYRARREQMIDQAGMLTRWKWRLTGVPVDEQDEYEE
jgi:chromosome segregation ATPase